MYKTKLQELCHKKSWNLPEYSSRKEGPDHNARHHATVLVNGRSFDTISPASSSKKAQNDAAQLAFDYFSSIPPPTPVDGIPQVNDESAAGKASTVQAPNTNQLPPVDGPTIVTKIENKITENLCKTLLQTYAQKKSLALPSYSSERIGPPHAMRFKCKVTVGGQTYKSHELFTTLSKAEHDAARIALSSLAPQGIEEDESAYKNLLQELAQKESHQLPKYSTSGSGESHKPTFISTVEVGGETFTGLEAKTKKQAEFSAAKVAYTNLKQRNSKQSPLISSSAIPSAQPIVISSADLKPSLKLENSNPTLSPPRQRQRIVQIASRSRPDFAAFLHKNAPIQPELSSSDEDLVQKKGFVEASSKAQDRVIEIIGNVSPCPPSGSSVCSLSKVDSPFDSSASSAVISSAEREIVADFSGQNKVVVHPRSMNVSYPPGSTVLPVSDDNWVAVNISAGSKEPTQ